MSKRKLLIIVFICTLMIGGLFYMIPDIGASISFYITPTICFKEEDGVLKQLIKLTIRNLGISPIDLVCVIKTPEASYEVPIAVKAFASTIEFVGVPRVTKPQQITVSLHSALRNWGTITATLKPERLWKIHVIPSTHMDLSWPSDPDTCLAWNIEAIKEAVRLCRVDPDFKYTVEGVYPLREYLKTASQEDKEFLRTLIQSGRVEVTGFHVGVETPLAWHESLIRQLYDGALWVKKNLGVEVKSVWDVDIPGMIAQIPQILNKSRIKYFVITPYMEPGETEPGTSVPYLFYWESPDGSKVLTYICPWGYGASFRIGLRNSFYETFKNLPYFLETVAKAYNYSTVMVADGTDCTQPSLTVMEVIREWNSRFAYPKFIMSTASEFLEDVENEPDIPTYRGEWINGWVATVPQEAECCMMSGEAEHLLRAAEKFAAVSHLVDPDEYVYPAENLSLAWTYLGFAQEHNWAGTRGDISDLWKLNKATTARNTGLTVLRTATDYIASKINLPTNDVSIIVFNPLSWNRTDIVTTNISFEEPGVKSMTLTDHTNKIVRFQLNSPMYYPDGSLKSAEIVFIAEDVPSIGYKTYRVAPSFSPVIPREAPQVVVRESTEGVTIENDFYKVIVYRLGGLITSIYDKELRKELVSQSSKYKFCELIALEDVAVDLSQGLSGNEYLSSNYVSTVSVNENGSVRASVSIRGQFFGCSRDLEIILYSDIKRIDFNLTIDWEGVKRYQVMTCLPFNVPKPEVFYESPYYAVKLGSDEIPGSQYYLESLKSREKAETWGWWGFRNVKNWVEISDEDYGITYLTRIGAARLYENGTIFPALLRTVYSCGDPNLFYTQEGTHIFRFSIYSHRGSWKEARAFMAGTEFHTPLMVKMLTGKRIGVLPEEKSFLNVDVGDVMIATVKLSEDGEDMILRIFNSQEAPITVNLYIFKELSQVWITNMIEEEVSSIQQGNNYISISIGSFEVVTLKIKMHSLKT